MTDFALVEQLFADLLAEANDVLSKDEANEVQRFIDVGEYGVAIETAISIFVEERKSASPATKAKIGQILTSMDMHINIMSNIP